MALAKAGITIATTPHSLRRSYATGMLEAGVCLRCDIEMNCIENLRRPSWREVFRRRIHADPAIDWPMHHDPTTGFPAFAYEPYG